MKLAKRSSAFQRVYDKQYKFIYVRSLIQIFIRKGFKMRSILLISRFFYLIKVKYLIIDPIKYLTALFDKYAPVISFVSKKVAANVYYLPVYINLNRARVLIVRWFFLSVCARTENILLDRLINEFSEMDMGYGKTIRQLEDFYSLAIKNRPFMRFLKKKRKVVRSRLKKFGIR